MEQKPTTGEKSEKLLIVDDDRSWQRSLARSLQEKVTLLQAFSLEQGEQIFLANPDVDLIVMDGCVPGYRLNSLPLIRKIRETYKGPIVAASSDADNREEMVRAGCSHNVRPANLFEIFKELLDL